MNNFDANIKNTLDKLLLDYKIQPVGWSYIDCVTTKENVPGFIQSLTDLGIKVTAITWWCHCAIEGSEDTGCPHGGGGPRSRYFDGYFSEMYQIPNIKITDNNEIEPYIFDIWPTAEEYLPCLIPAFWLDVPDDWRNTVDMGNHVDRITIHKIVKKEIDEYNLYDLLPEAPSDEFDGESARIASQINTNSTVEEIATIIADEFSKSFGEIFTQKDFMMTVEKIYKSLKNT